MGLKLVGFKRTNMITAVSQMFGALGNMKPWEDHAL